MFCKKKETDGAKEFVSRVLKRKKNRKVSLNDTSDIEKNKYDIYNLMKDYIPDFKAISAKLDEIIKIDSEIREWTKVLQWFQNPNLWRNLFVDSEKMLSEEEDVSASISKKKSLHRVLADLQSIVADEKMKSILDEVFQGRKKSKKKNNFDFEGDS